MGLPPKGEIVARPIVARSCGCLQEFQHYAVDKYRAQRLAKFQQSRCPACVARLVEEQRRAAPIPKGEALKLLPPGTQVVLSLQPDGSWTGTLGTGGKVVEIAGAGGAGPQAVVVALARLWLSTHGVQADQEPGQPTT
jgi:hypothetical protein